MRKANPLLKHPLYYVWKGVIKRCEDPKYINYHHYGGRGITICPEWRYDYFSFYNWAIENGWQKGLFLDRRENDGNYEPGNCRFITPLESSRNKRNVILIEHDGQKKSIAEWAEIFGLKYSTLWHRLNTQKKPFLEAIIKAANDNPHVKNPISIPDFVQKPYSTPGKFGIEPLQSFVVRVKREYLSAVLEHMRFNVSETAKVLGVDRKTIYNILETE